jgi:ADP-heptose:LPS heptosyltransferase
MHALPVGEKASPDMQIAADCRYFLGDRPCVWHKRDGLLCACDHYAPLRERILIIKLDAMGDVLRTTALLPPLARAHPQAAIEWVTRPESLPLLERNPFLTDIIAYGPDALVRLQATSYDRVINLDAGKVSAGLASLAQAPRKEGFVLHQRGHVVATNGAAQSWLEMGINDNLKRSNRRTYQSVMLEILGLPADGHRYVLELSPDERAWARSHLARLGLQRQRPVVGLNMGAGGRWELKRWHVEGFLELAERLHQWGAQVMLLGGKTERDRHAEMQARSAVPLMDPGTDNTLRQFAALTESCNVVVAGDTLGLHVALALERRIVALFGPTSAPEIELYDLGEKVLPDMTCLGCYKSTCDFTPNCMDLISVDMVAAAVSRQLGHGRDGSHTPDQDTWAGLPLHVVQ